MYAVIMAGGEGTRLWPMSNKKTPKPVLTMPDGKTLLELSLIRTARIAPLTNIFVITTSFLKAAIENTIPEFPRENLIIEPVPKNTAPCIALAAVHIIGLDPNAVMAIFPVDHIIRNESRFLDAVHWAGELSEKKQKIVILGLKPSRPITGYGHILIGEAVAEIGGYKTYNVERFIEKPSLELAIELVQRNNCLWNSGIYIGTARMFLEEIKKYLPYVYTRLTKAKTNSIALEEAYMSFEAISIDHGVAERSQNLWVIDSDIDRIDVGNFEAFHSIWDKDRLGNAVEGKFYGMDASDNIVFSPTKPTVALGVKNLVIIDTHDYLLVCPRSHVQQIKIVKEKIQREDG